MLICGCVRCGCRVWYWLFWIMWFVVCRCIMYVLVCLVCWWVMWLVLICWVGFMIRFLLIYVCCCWWRFCFLGCRLLLCGCCVVIVCCCVIRIIWFGCCLIGWLFRVWFLRVVMILVCRFLLVLWNLRFSCWLIVWCLVWCCLSRCWGVWSVIWSVRFSSVVLWVWVCWLCWSVSSRSCNGLMWCVSRLRSRLLVCCWVWSCMFFCLRFGLRWLFI